MIFNSCNLEGNLLLKGRESQTEVGHTEKKKSAHICCMCMCVFIMYFEESRTFVFIMSQSMYSNDITRNLIMFSSILLSSVLFYSKILLKS